MTFSTGPFDWRHPSPDPPTLQKTSNGEDRTAIELFIAGLRGWGTECGEFSTLRRMRGDRKIDSAPQPKCGINSRKPTCVPGLGSDLFGPPHIVSYEIHSGVSLPQPQHLIAMLNQPKPSGQRFSSNSPSDSDMKSSLPSV